MITGSRDEQVMLANIGRATVSLERIALALEEAPTPDPALLAEVQRARNVAWRIAVSLGMVGQTEELPDGTDIEDLWAEYSTRIGIERAKAAAPLIDPARRAEMVASLRADMAGAVRSQVGSGFVPDYYQDLASEFVAVAEHLADEVARGDWA